MKINKKIILIGIVVILLAPFIFSSQTPETLADGEIFFDNALPEEGCPSIGSVADNTGTSSKLGSQREDLESTNSSWRTYFSFNMTGISADPNLLGGTLTYQVSTTVSNFAPLGARVHYFYGNETIGATLSGGDCDSQPFEHPTTEILASKTNQTVTLAFTVPQLANVYGGRLDIELIPTIPNFADMDTFYWIIRQTEGGGSLTPKLTLNYETPTVPTGTHVVIKGINVMKIRGNGKVNVI